MNTAFFLDYVNSHRPTQTKSQLKARPLFSSEYNQANYRKQI